MQRSHNRSTRNFPFLGPKPDLNLGPILCLTIGLLCTGLLACGEADESGAAPSRQLFDSGQTQFPGATWIEIDDPSAWGWSEQDLHQAQAYFQDLESETVMVVHRGVLIAAWGDVSKRYNGQSIRKAFLGALIGQEVDKGDISLQATLAELGIDEDVEPLHESEKAARVVDLLHSASGVYRSAIYEAGGWKRNKPERGSHSPGEAWYYNNWGFNALGTIFEQASGETIHEAFSERLAGPIGMEDYRPKDVQYLSRDSLSEKIQKNDSEHRAYVFMVSTRDLARFGLLYLNAGRWDGRQIVPEAWVERSIEDSIPTLEFLAGDRFGYLWWVSPIGSALGQAIGHDSFKATGGRGHKVVVVPDLDLVVVHRLATGGVGLSSQMRRRLFGTPSVDDRQFNELMRLIVEAHPSRQPGADRPKPAESSPPPTS